LVLDALAKRYKKLPSELLDRNIEDLQVDWICLEAGIKEENRQSEKASRKVKGKYGRP